MSAMAPIALATLQRTDADRRRRYRAPMPALLLPTAFASANLIIYWGGFDFTWKLACAVVLGRAFFAIGSSRARCSACLL
jgi:hypothetical protein